MREDEYVGQSIICLGRVTGSINIVKLVAQDIIIGT